MSKINIIKIHCLLFVAVLFALPAVCSAASANLTILHDNPDLKAVKYIFKYGNVEQTNPQNYPYTVEVRPAGGKGVIGQSTTLVDLGENFSGDFYFSVKIVYENGTETEFSESSFAIPIPSKPTNLKSN